MPIVLTEEESKPAEQFIFLCWTRHSHTLVQELMESTKQYVAEKQYAEALAALSEVIKIDPFFAEAYNRRATVHFGLKCADDCFADIERVSRGEGRRGEGREGGVKKGEGRKGERKRGKGRRGKGRGEVCICMSINLSICVYVYSPLCLFFYLSSVWN